MHYEHRMGCISAVYLAYLFIKVLNDDVLELIWRCEAVLLVGRGVILPLKQPVCHGVGLFQKAGLIKIRS